MLSALFGGTADLNFDIKTRTPVYNSASGGCIPAGHSVSSAMPTTSLDSTAKTTTGTPKSD
ncbi:MAG: hypothetical protein JWO08_926 [Verrucomicrobiaceae bacterium]|nr:hypothetical protein [Verrucomicrobiaceae bacterium]